MTAPVTPGRLYLIDTSAHARINHESVRAVIAGLIIDRAAATCVTVDLEAGYSGRDEKDVLAIAERRRTRYIVLPVNESIAERAREVQRRMAARGQHRAAGLVDLLTAAVAEYHDAIVLHYDADFEHIVAATGHRPAAGVGRRPRHVALSRDSATTCGPDTLVNRVSRPHVWAADGSAEEGGGDVAAAGRLPLRVAT